MKGMTFPSKLDPKFIFDSLLLVWSLINRGKANCEAPELSFVWHLNSMQMYIEPMCLAAWKRWRRGSHKRAGKQTRKKGHDQQPHGQIDLWPDVVESSSRPGVSAPFLTKPVPGTVDLGSSLDSCSPQKQVPS